jgi:S-methylmethionine-dependent homocysteine/selenocysteine methylase
MANIKNLFTRLAKKEIIILDGGTGTELQRRGVKTTLPLWSAQALLNAPDVVRELHLDYIKAGADVIKTNTFRTNRRTLAKVGLTDKDAELTKLAVRLAREAVEQANAGRDVFIGGCQAPLEDCYEPSLVPTDDAVVLDEHRRWSSTLADGGVDFIFLETFNTVREARLALQAAHETALPAVVSFVCDAQTRLLSGEPLAQAVAAVEPLKPFAILVNCMQPVDITPALKELHKLTTLPIGAYGQGLGEPHNDQGWTFKGKDNGVQEYCNHAGAWLKAGATLVGGCCGTNPAYVAAIKRLAAK